MVILQRHVRIGYDARVILQIILAGMNIRGVNKNETDNPAEK